MARCGLGTWPRAKGIEPFARLTVRAPEPIEGRQHDVTCNMRYLRMSGYLEAVEKFPMGNRPSTMALASFTHESRALHCGMTWIGSNRRGSDQPPTACSPREV
jgi:hypothetical protein